MTFHKIVNRALPRTAAALLLYAAASVAPAAAATFPTTVTLRNFFKVGTDSLTFNRPVSVKPYPAEDSAFIVVQQSGQILTVRWNGTAWRRTDTATVAVLAGTSGINEQGLLGFTFHPDYLTNHKYYVYFVGGSGSTYYDIIAERTAGSSLRPATSDAQRTVLRISDPYDNHNSGTILFDQEGYLLFGIGDGGTTSGDPQNRAQNTDSLLGKFLRFDVNGADAFPSDTTRNYAIPATNPWRDTVGVKPEIWAYGMRNPFKWTLNPATGTVFAGDVGQDTWEKITRVPKAANLGWRFREGPVCFNPATNCPSAGITFPDLSLKDTMATAIIGGTFFQAVPGTPFADSYIFGDHGSSRIWAVRVVGDSILDSTLTQIGTLNKPVSFDRDRQGRVLVTTISPSVGFGISSNVGRVLVLESPDMSPTAVSYPPRASRAAAAPGTFRMNELRAHPERFKIMGLDGRALLGTPSGTFLVIEKANPSHRALMTALW